MKKERVEEALALKHCALSLVGEPIMYPHIAEFIDLLHAWVWRAGVRRRHGTSSFLVTNAQFPEEIRRVPPVTQFYIGGRLHEGGPQEAGPPAVPRLLGALQPVRGGGARARGGVRGT